MRPSTLPCPLIAIVISLYRKTQAVSALIFGRALGGANSAYVLNGDYPRPPNHPPCMPSVGDFPVRREPTSEPNWGILTHYRETLLLRGFRRYPFKAYRGVF